MGLGVTLADAETVSVILKEALGVALVEPLTVEETVIVYELVKLSVDDDGENVVVAVSMGVLVKLTVGVAVGEAKIAS